jgi:SagB-type dehydrogenase family enzyme
MLLSPTPFPKDEWEWDEIAKIFHLGTQDANGSTTAPSIDEWVDTYLQQNEALLDSFDSFFTHSKGERFILPPPDFTAFFSKSFLETLQRHQTAYTFKEAPLSLTSLSTLLLTCFGLFHGPWKNLKELSLANLGQQKNHLSNGSFHFLDAYIIVNNVGSLPKGLYHYYTPLHQLMRLGDPPPEDKFLAMLGGQQSAKNISIGLFLVADFKKIWQRSQNSRAYRFALIETGKVAQTLHLCAAALKLQGWSTTTFVDSSVTSHLKLESPRQAPLFFIGLGKGMLESIPEDFYDYLKSFKGS